MIQWFNKQMSKKRKGFTLIELIVVIAILGILAAIAIPRFTGMRNEATVKAQGSTALSIISAARIQEAETGKVAAGVMVNGNDAAATNLPTKYMILPSSPSYTLAKTDGTASYGNVTTPSAGLYVITWTSAAPGFAGTQTIVEGYNFVPASY